MQSLWMVLSAFVFAVMGVCVKLAATHYNTGEIVFYRSIIGVVLLYVIARSRGGTLRTPYLKSHVMRSATGVVALGLWFYSLSLLPLATAMTLNYMAPVWIALITIAAMLRRHEQPAGLGLVGTIVAGFSGATLLLQPSLQGHGWAGAIAGLAAGIFSAIAYVQVRDLGRSGEPEWRIVFYFSLGGVLLGLAWMLMAGVHALTLPGAMLMLSIGMTALIAQVALTRAFSHGHTLVTANLQYSGVIFAALMGMLVWDDWPATSGWIGMVLIVASSMFAALRRPLAAPRETVSQ